MNKLIEAVRFDKIDILKNDIHNIDVNKKDSKGKTLLAYSIFDSSEKCFDFLLQQNLDLDQNVQCYTILDYCIYCIHSNGLNIKYFEKLLDKGFDKVDINNLLSEKNKNLLDMVIEKFIKIDYLQPFGF